MKAGNAPGRSNGCLAAHAHAAERCRLAQDGIPRLRGGRDANAMQAVPGINAYPAGIECARAHPDAAVIVLDAASHLFPEGIALRSFRPLRTLWSLWPLIARITFRSGWSWRPGIACWSGGSFRPSIALRPRRPFIPVQRKHRHWCGSYGVAWGQRAAVDPDFKVTGLLVKGCCAKIQLDLEQPVLDRPIVPCLSGSNLIAASRLIKEAKFKVGIPGKGRIPLLQLPLIGESGILG